MGGQREEKRRKEKKQIELSRAVAARSRVRAAQSIKSKAEGLKTDQRRS